jgi:hypothetical protein
MPSEKAREVKLRKMAKRQGLELRKPYRRDRLALDFNQFFLTERFTKDAAGRIKPVARPHELGPFQGLDAVESWLTTDPADRPPVHRRAVPRRRHQEGDLIMADENTYDRLGQAYSRAIRTEPLADGFDRETVDRWCRNVAADLLRAAGVDKSTCEMAPLLLKVGLITGVVLARSDGADPADRKEI